MRIALDIPDSEVDIPVFGGTGTRCRSETESSAMDHGCDAALLTLRPLFRTSFCLSDSLHSLELFFGLLCIFVRSRFVCSWRWVSAAKSVH